MNRGFLVHSICKATDPPQSTTTRTGKVRGMSLPPEYELTKFISNVQGLYMSWSTATPACEWDGVMCREEGEVIRIAWHARELSGTLHWDSIPRSVKKMDLSSNELSGCINFASLPLDLKKCGSSATGLLVSCTLRTCHLPCEF